MKETRAQLYARRAAYHRGRAGMPRHHREPRGCFGLILDAFKIFASFCAVIVLYHASQNSDDKYHAPANDVRTSAVQHPG